MSSILKVDQLQDSGGNAIITSDGSGNVTQNKTGITEADQWRITSNFALSANTQTVVNSNWERADEPVSGRIGTGMTESSGIFTFPQTGIYRIEFTISWNANLATDYRGAIIQATYNNSTYNSVTDGYTFAASNTQYSNITISYILDITNTSTHKARFVVESSAAQILRGNSNQTRTGVVFLRLGDT
jgi:hypothetical protein